MAPPVDPALVRTQFEAMTNYFANSQQSVLTPLLQTAEANLAKFGPGAHDLPGITVDYGAQVASLRADIAQIGTWLTNARSVLASTGSGAIQAMRDMLANGSFSMVVEEGAATLEANAPAVALTTGAVTAGVVEAGGLSTLAWVGLGLAGGLVAIGLIGGGIYAWNRYHQPTQNTAAGAGITTSQTVEPSTTDTGPQLLPPTAPGIPTAGAEPTTSPPALTTEAAPPLAPGPTTTTAPPTLDVDGTYTMSPCSAAQCSMTVAKQSDAAGPQWSEAGTVALTIVEKSDPSSANDSQQIGPMSVSLRQDGSFQGSGTATEGDFGGLGKLTSHPIQFSVYGQFRGSQGGPPTTTGGPVVYHLTLNGNSAANTNGALSATGSR